MSLSDVINDSLITLSTSLSINSASTDTHLITEVTGWQEENALNALAMYLVGLRACIIDQAGKICSELINKTPDLAADILRSVDEIVVQSSNSSEDVDDWKSQWRNPWIAEGIWHCCMRLAMIRREIHTPGIVIAIDLPHISPKDHGIDVTTLYVKADGILGISIIETKAYKDNPNAAISDAVIMFKSIECGVHDTRLRQIVTLFRSIIEDTHKEQLSLSLWKNERTMIPNPHYDATGSTVRWTRRRSVFSDIKAPVIIMPHRIHGFNAFFDEVANKMRIKARELSVNV